MVIILGIVISAVYFAVLIPVVIGLVTRSPVTVSILPKGATILAQSVASLCDNVFRTEPAGDRSDDQEAVSAISSYLSNKQTRLATFWKWYLDQIRFSGEEVNHAVIVRLYPSLPPVRGRKQLLFLLAVSIAASCLGMLFAGAVAHLPVTRYAALWLLCLITADVLVKAVIADLTGFIVVTLMAGFMYLVGVIAGNILVAEYYTNLLLIHPLLFEFATRLPAALHASLLLLYLSTLLIACSEHIAMPFFNAPPETDTQKPLASIVFAYSYNGIIVFFLAAVSALSLFTILNQLLPMPDAMKAILAGWGPASVLSVSAILAVIFYAVRVYMWDAKFEEACREAFVIYNSEHPAKVPQKFKRYAEPKAKYIRKRT